MSCKLTTEEKKGKLEVSLTIISSVGCSGSSDVGTNVALIRRNLFKQGALSCLFSAPNKSAPLWIIVDNAFIREYAVWIG